MRMGLDFAWAMWMAERLKKRDANNLARRKAREKSRVRKKQKTRSAA